MQQLKTFKKNKSKNGNHANLHKNFGQKNQKNKKNLPNKEKKQFAQFKLMQMT